MNAALRFLHAARRCEIRGLEQLAVTCGLVADIGAFTHVLQRERGMSNLHLASRAERFELQLEQRIADCEACEQTLRASFDRLDTDARRTASGTRLFTRIAHVLHGVDGLPELRVRIRSRRLSAEEASDALTRLIGGLLAVVFEAADTAADPQISRALVAMFNFMQGKELAGQERATGAAGFAAGRFDVAQKQKMAYLIEAQERSFDIFVEFADQQLGGCWHDAQAGAELAGLERLRRIAASANACTTAPPDAGELWFELASRRIDAMKLIEDRLALSLAELCRSKIAQARADLHSDTGIPATVESQPRQSHATVAVFLEQGDPLAHPDAVRNAAAVVAADGMGRHLGRSILDLVQEQSRRLQVMNDELEAVRKALDERKLVERAKGVLMCHHDLTEDQAYRLLRQTAMQQSRRLADVAEAVLSFSGIFGQR